MKTSEIRVKTLSILICIILSTVLSTELTGTYKIIKAIATNQLLYTQGIFLSDSGKTLYHSSGLYGSSKLVQMRYPSLKVVSSTNLGSNYFAEGVARCGNIVYLLTWKERTIFRFSYPNLTYLGYMNMDSRINEGWGLSSYSASELIASDGSSNIYILDCNNFLKVKSTIRVRLNGQPLVNINALSFSKGKIWANVFYTSNIYVIDPHTGQVTQTYNMSPLVNYEIKQGTLNNYLLNSGNVLNGIAYNKIKDVFVLTGKNWGYYYEVKFN